MGKRRFGCATVVFAVLVTAMVVIAVMALRGPWLSQQLARLTNPLTAHTPTRLADQVVATEPPAETPIASLPAPSLTPTDPPAATPTSEPTSTPIPTPAPDAVVLAEVLNLRGGPGTIYAKVGSLRKGDALQAVARTRAGDWLSVIAPDGKKGWVAANLVQLNIPRDQIPLVTNIPAPPVTPTPRSTATPRPTRSVDDQIAALAKGQHGQLPQPGSTGSVAAGGDAELTILNDTPHRLTVLIGSPNGVTVVVEPCPTCSVYQGLGPLSCQESGRPRQVVRIKPGTMQVAARVSDPNVIPFLGTWNLGGDTGYLNCFFIVTRIN